MARTKRRMSAKARAAALRNLAKARRARGGGKRRRVRLSNRAPRRRRYTMARKRRGGGRRKGFNVTPKNLAKLGVIVAAIQVANQPAGLIEGVRYQFTNGKQTLGTPKAAMDTVVELGKRAIAPVAIAVVGPKLIDAGVKVLAKGSSGVNRVANYKIARV